jgi:hypothetical protein
VVAFGDGIGGGALRAYRSPEAERRRAGLDREAPDGWAGLSRKVRAVLGCFPFAIKANLHGIIVVMIRFLCYRILLVPNW